jgi:hypothetical protein
MSFASNALILLHLKYFWVTPELQCGGERGIRTLETVARLHAFQACAFNHSATSPEQRPVAGRVRSADYTHDVPRRKRWRSGLSGEIMHTAPTGFGPFALQHHSGMIR